MMFLLHRTILLLFWGQVYTFDMYVKSVDLTPLLIGFS